MQFRKKIEEAKQVLAADKKYFLATALIALIGIGLRLSFINATDISGDEVFFVTYAYKIAYLLWQAPLVAIALAAIIAVFAYLIVVKRSLATAVVGAAILLLAKYAFAMPYLVPRVGPVYILTTAAVIYFSNLVPNIAGELISTLSMLGLAFVALYLGSKWNKAVGFCAFTLIMVSPYNIFMSATSFVSPLGMFLLFSSLAVFFKGLEDSRFLPLAGVLAALGYATRFPTIVSLPVFLAIAFLNKDSLLKKENRKNVAIFITIILAAVLFLAPFYNEQLTAVGSWDDDLGRWDLVEAHMSAFVASAADPVLDPREDHFFVVRAMNLFYSPFFMLLLAMAIPFAAYHICKQKDVRLAAVLFIGLAIFFAFFVVLAGYQRINRGLGFEFPFIMAVSFMLCSGKRFFTARRLAATLLVGIFLVSSINVIVSHDFKGLSSFAQSIPEESVVLGSQAFYQLTYYRGIYKFDVSIRKPFFDRIFVPDLEKEALFQEKKRLIASGFEELDRVDYVVVRETEMHLTEENLARMQQLGFKECKPIENEGQLMLLVFAKEVCP